MYVVVVVIGRIIEDRVFICDRNLIIRNVDIFKVMIVLRIAIELGWVCSG